MIWDRCSDLQGRSTAEFSHDGNDWIVWQVDSDSTWFDQLNPAGREGVWQGLQFPNLFPDFPALFELEVAYRTSIDRDSIRKWLAVRQEKIRSVHRLVERHGVPPIEVLRDWKRQMEVGGNLLVYPSDALDHVLASRDGRLVSLSSIESCLNRSTTPAVSFASQVIPPSEFDPNVIFDAERTATYEAVPIGEFVASHLDAPRKTSGDLQPVDRSMDSAIEMPRRLSIPTTEKISENRRSKSRRNPTVIWIGTIAACLLLIGVVSVSQFSRSKDVLKRQDTALADRLKSDNDIADLTLSGELAMAELDGQLQLSPDESSLNSELLSTQAADSVQVFLSGFGDKSKNVVDTISFASVESILEKTNGASIVKESLAESNLNEPTKMASNENPFPEPLDGPAPSDASTDVGLTSVRDIPADSPDESTANVGFSVQSLSIKQAQQKATFRVPFKVNESQAICRAKLRVVDPLERTPSDPIELIGRQDGGWIVALEDDSLKLSIYLRSKPAKSWYIATVVRVRTGDNLEFLIGPQDATRVCARLQYYIRWLEENRLVGEQMRTTKKTQAMASAAIKEIDKQIKGAEKSLKEWIAVEALVQAFFRDNGLELELASSPEVLMKSR